jgi:hypothetical protein
MATYRARICPNCRYFLAFSISKSSASDKEVEVSSFCLNCSYRLPVHSILYGIRRAASKLKRARQKLTSSRELSGDRKPEHEPTSSRAASEIRTLAPQNCSAHLRAIGQQLQQERIENFNLQCTESSYAVWTHFDTLTWSNPSSLYSGRRPDKWQANTPAVSATLAHARFEYSVEDLADMESRARVHRNLTGSVADGHSLSHLLRTIGSLAFERNQRLLAISWRDSSICVVVETAQGKREIEVFRMDNLYDLWVKMYLRRAHRALSDVPH